MGSKLGCQHLKKIEPAVGIHSLVLCDYSLCQSCLRCFATVRQQLPTQNMHVRAARTAQAAQKIAEELGHISARDNSALNTRGSHALLTMSTV